MAGLLCYLVVKDQVWETIALPDLSATPSTLTVYCAPLARDDDGVSVAFRLVESGFTVAFTSVLPFLRSVKVGDAMLGLEGIGNQHLDVELECLGERVPEHLRGRLIPEYYPLGLRVRNYDRIPDSLKEPVEPQVLWSHASSCSHAFSDIRRFQLAVSWLLFLSGILLKEDDVAVRDMAFRRL